MCNDSNALFGGKYCHILVYTVVTVLHNCNINNCIPLIRLNSAAVIIGFRTWTVVQKITIVSWYQIFTIYAYVLMPSTPSGVANFACRITQFFAFLKLEIGKQVQNITFYLYLQSNLRRGSHRSKWYHT